MSHPTDPDGLPSTRPIDALAFSPLIPALLGIVLTGAVGRAIAPEADLGERAPLALLAGAGTAVVYGLDRLRDRERDRETSPLRTAFVERHRTAIGATTAAAALLALGLATRVPNPVIALCGAIGAAGLLHRRLKRFAAIKTLYVSIAWTGICVGLPWLGLARFDPPCDITLALGAALFPCFVANLIASNLRDGESHWSGEDPARGIATARALSALGCAAALLGPAPVRAFIWIGLLSSLALARNRPTEHYGHLAIDGSLLAGALATALTQTLL